MGKPLLEQVSSEWVEGGRGWNEVIPEVPPTQTTPRLCEISVLQQKAVETSTEGSGQGWVPSLLLFVLQNHSLFLYLFGYFSPALGACPASHSSSSIGQFLASAGRRVQELNQKEKSKCSENISREFWTCQRSEGAPQEFKRHRRHDSSGGENFK